MTFSTVTTSLTWPLRSTAAASMAATSRLGVQSSSAASPAHRVRTGTGAATAGTAENRLDQLTELRAAAELRKTFGDIAEARAVLLRLAELMDRLDTDGHQPELPDTKPATRHRSTRLNNTARAGTKEDG
jgi:hypothetical protein